MSNASTFFKGFENRLKQQIRTTMPASVVKYDAANQTCDLQILFKMVDDDGEEFKQPMLEDVPILGHRIPKMTIGGSISGIVVDSQSTIDSSKVQITIDEHIVKPKYKKDDVVMISVCERSIDNLQKKPFLPDSVKMFSIKDAVIIGGWELE